jgi:hypothetical protein
MTISGRPKVYGMCFTWPTSAESPTIDILYETVEEGEKSQVGDLTSCPLIRITGSEDF